MKKYRRLQLSLMVLICISGFKSTAQDDEPFFSFHRLTTGISIDAGKFELEGNDGESELRHDRDENRAEGKSIGIGLALNYEIYVGLDVFFIMHYDYISEPLGDKYGYNAKDFGLRYKFMNLGGVYPFVKLSYTSYVLDGLSVLDFELPNTQSFKREYDYKGTGSTLGFGLEMKMNETLSVAVEYNKLFTTSFEAFEGLVEFDNTPKYRDFRFLVRIGL